MKPDANTLAQLELLKRQFAAGMPQRLQGIDAALDACVAAPGNPAANAAPVTELHSLAGAVIFGFNDLR